MKEKMSVKGRGLDAVCAFKLINQLLVNLIQAAIVCYPKPDYVSALRKTVRHHGEGSEPCGVAGYVPEHCIILPVFHREGDAERYMERERQGGVLTTKLAGKLFNPPAKRLELRIHIQRKPQEEGFVHSFASKRNTPAQQDKGSSVIFGKNLLISFIGHKIDFIIVPCCIGQIPAWFQRAARSKRHVSDIDTSVFMQERQQAVDALYLLSIG